MAAPEKKYGLILSAKKAGPIGPAKKPSVFNDDDASDEDTKKPAIKKESIGQTILKRQTQLEIDRALAEDPSVYEYDAVYDDLKAKQHEQKTTAAKDKADQKKPKYIAGLMKMAEVRKKEEERRIERGVQRERQAEGEAFADKEQFVTSAYRQKLIEMREAEEKERREAELEAKLDVTNQRDLSGFYRHLYRQAAGEEERVPSSSTATNDAASRSTSGESKPPHGILGSDKPASGDQVSAKSVKHSEGDRPPKDTDRDSTRDRHRSDGGRPRGDRPISVSPDRRSGSSHKSDDRERQRDSRRAKVSQHESRTDSAARESTTRLASSRHSGDRQDVSHRRERDDSDARNRDKNATRPGGRRSSDDRHQSHEKPSDDSSRRHAERSRRAKHADSSSDSSSEDERVTSKSRAKDGTSVESCLTSERQRGKTGSNLTSGTPLESRGTSRSSGDAVSPTVHEAAATERDRNRHASSGSSSSGSSSSGSSSRPTPSMSRTAEAGTTKTSEAKRASDANAEKDGTDDWTAKYARRHNSDSVDQARARYLARKASNAVVPVVSRSKDD